MTVQLPEMRVGKIRGRWSIFAENRSKRTSDPNRGCPLCLSNEMDLPQRCGHPHILYEEKDDSGFLVRVVPNKFLLLMIEGNTDVRNIDDVFDRTDAFGAHELVIDSRKHICPIQEMEPKEIMAVWRCFIARYFDLKKDPRMKFFFMFRNYGKPAGASLEHPHSQIAVYPVIPTPEVDKMVFNFQHSADKYNRCPACHLIEHELRDQQRLVSQNDFFVAIEPYDSIVPYETWIMPKKIGVFHSPSFAHFLRDIPLALEALAEILIDTFDRLNKVVPGLSYNMMLYTAPYGADNEQGTFHWFTMIQPVTTTPGGNEKGTGIYANSLLPEKAAEALRAAR